MLGPATRPFAIIFAVRCYHSALSASPTCILPHRTVLSTSVSVPLSPQYTHRQKLGGQTLRPFIRCATVHPPRNPPPQPPCHPLCTTLSILFAHGLLTTLTAPPLRPSASLSAGGSDMHFMYLCLLASPGPNLTPKAAICPTAEPHSLSTACS